MLTNAALRNFKPKSKTYKASDRDGMYVTVSPTGTVRGRRRPPGRKRPTAGQGAQPLTARTTRYVKGNSKTVSHTPPATSGKRSAQAGTQGRPETSGIKAEWPRFGTKRGAQPASPKAARRDARYVFTTTAFATGIFWATAV